jgi:hypothetical protein
MDTDREFLEAVSGIDQALPDTKGFAPPSQEEICRIFNEIKGKINAILPFVEMIPVYGKAIAKALRLLLQLGEAVCPA